MLWESGGGVSDCSDELTKNHKSEKNRREGGWGVVNFLPNYSEIHA